MSAKTYAALGAVLHDGERFAPGAPIELEEAQAAPLLAAGAIGPAPEEATAADEPPASKPGGKEPEPAEPAKPAAGGKTGKAAKAS